MSETCETLVPEAAPKYSTLAPGAMCILSTPPRIAAASLELQKNKVCQPIKELLGLNGTSRFKNANHCWKTGKSLIDINFDCFRPYSTSWLQFEGRNSKLIPPNFCLSNMERTRSRNTIYINCGKHTESKHPLP
jgi:hypothetical protein